MTRNEKLKEMAVTGTKVELELSTKEDAFYTGIVKEVGDDYVILDRQGTTEIKSKDAEGNDESYTEIYIISSIILIDDIRVLSVLKKVQ